MTRRTGNGAILTEDVLLINPEDAAKHGIAEGDMVCVESARGKVDIKALITDEVKPGILSSTPDASGRRRFHFPEMMLNLITRSPICCFAVHRLRERERLTGDVPGVQGGELGSGRRGRRIYGRRGRWWPRHSATGVSFSFPTAMKSALVKTL